MDRRHFLTAAAGASAAALAPFALSGTASAAGPWSQVTNLKTDWMSYLPDNISLHKLTIPGTHNSGALYGGDMTECQTLTITQQLESGIRFLDARCRAIEGNFAIHHDSYYQEMMFGNMLIACHNFLEDHPGETIVMRVKQEYSTLHNPEFRAIFDDYLDNRGWRSLFWTHSWIPQLHEARNKIVLLGDNGLPGIVWKGTRTEIQDDYKVPTLFDRDDKYKKVLKHVFKCMSNTEEKLFINFASGSSSGCYPYSVASYVNSALLQDVKKMESDYSPTHHPTLGIFAMDFPEYYTPDLIETLIRWNRR